MISFDTETTGLDSYHGARPFFLTTCTAEGELRYWEWDVDPLTRAPRIPPEDLREVGEYLFSDGPNGPRPYIGQNVKFDVRMLATVGLWDNWDLDAVWPDVHDTLIAGHLLASNRPHDLTSMAVQYLGVDIQPYEDRLQAACNKARRVARKLHPTWRIAKAGLADMPSAKDKPWKYDTWLPRCLRQHGYAEHPEWDTVLVEYANKDSEVTVALWQAMREEIRRRGLEEIYETRRQLLHIVYNMEQRGVTLSGNRLEELITEYGSGSRTAERVCVNLARGLGHDLSLPKSGRNKNLEEFLFEVLELPPVYNPKARTDNPCLNKAAMAHYAATLPRHGKAHTFITTLLGKRSRDVAVSYMEAYRRFWQPLYGPSPQAALHRHLTTVIAEGDTDELTRMAHADVTEELAPAAGGGEWYVLHPNLNICGTDTLRMSSNNPNEQNISKKEGFNLRYCFGPAPGREWWSMDARGIEDRLPAYKSQEKDLIAIFEEADKPPYYGSNHLLRFHTVYPEIWEKELRVVGLDRVGPYCKKKYAATYYQWCKNGGFAVQYGAVDRPDGKGTADTAFHKPGAHALLKQRFAKLEALNQHCIQFANKHGYIETMPDKTVNPRRGYPLLCSRTEYGKIKPTVPLNYYIQGSAMWWTMKAMLRCEEALAQWRHEGFDAWMTMQVHDEIVFDLPRAADPREDKSRSNLARARELMRLMELGGEDFGIPTPVGCEYHAGSWSEGASM